MKYTNDATPRLPMALRRELHRLVGRHLLLQEVDRQAYRYDGTSMGTAPSAVILPADAAEVAACLRVLAHHGFPVIIRGAGTNLSGATTFLAGCAVILETGRMSRVLSIDAVNGQAEVEPGVRNQELQDAAAPVGLYYPPDPASMAVSTLGGNVAENSGGPKCVKHGVTGRYVLGLEVVLPDGTTIHTGGVSAVVPGYDLTGVIVGSEGTFGVVTRVRVRLSPLPLGGRTLLATYNHLDDAARTVSFMIAAGVSPTTLELIDDVVLKAVEENVRVGYPLDAEAVLLIELEGLPEVLVDEVARVERICRDQGAREVRVAASQHERELLWRGRREACGALARLRPSYAEEDVGVPPSLIPEMLREIKEIGRRNRLVIGNVFHAGDGNFHPTVLYDERDPAETDRMKKANFEIIRAATERGGTITGEHGVGRLKLIGMPLMFGPEELCFMAGLKRVFDPRGVLNPGKVIPTECGEGGDSASAPTTTAEGLPARHPPAVPAEIREALAEAADLRSQLWPVGAASKFGFGPRANPPAGVIRLCTKAIPKRLEIDRANLKATVSASVTLVEFQAALAQAGLYFPAEPYWPGIATMGAIVATGDAGPGRLRYGEVRDNVLGLSFILSDGRHLRVGGQTVKNVAGYDVKRLLIGSWGTLGLLFELTVRVFPLPEATTVLVRFSSVERMTAFATAALTSRKLDAAAFDVVDLDPRTEAGPRPSDSAAQSVMALIRFDGQTKAKTLQVDQASRLAEASGGELEVLSPEDAVLVWAGRADFPERWARRAGAGWLRIGYLRAELSTVYRDLTALAGEEGRLVFTAQAASGVADAFIVKGQATLTLAGLADRIGRQGGTVYPMSLGRAWSPDEAAPLFGRRDDAGLAVQIKAYFDPSNRFGDYRV